MDTLLELYRNPTELIAWGGYTVLAIIVFAETGLLIGFFLPGDSLLVTAGLFAATKPDVLDIAALNALLIPMAIIGDACGYYIGHRSGKRIFDRPDSRFFKRKHLLATQAFYEKHGGKTIILARFMPFARTFAPVVAGVAEMGYRRFATFNIAGGFLWIGSMTLLGYFLGNIPNADKYVHYIIVAVIAASISPGVYAYLRARFAPGRSQPAE